MALAFTVYTALDCRFIKGPSAEIDGFTLQFLFNNTLPEDFEYESSELRGLGFFSWEAMDGSCASEFYLGSNVTYTDTNNNTYSVRDIACHVYYTYLVGTDWKTPRAMAVLSSVVAFVAVMWTLTLSCMAHKRRYRTILSFLLMIVLPILQSLTFLVFRTDYCDVYGCEYGSSSYATAAVVAYFLSGLLLCVGTTDFPGNPYIKRKRPAHCANLLCCRNTCLQHVEEPEDSEHQSTESADPTSIPSHAEVIEVPVERDFIDAALIDGDVAVIIAPEPVEISIDSLTTSKDPTSCSSSALEPTILPPRT